MKQFDDARELTKHARDAFAKIEQAYRESLHDKEVKPRLLVEIKNVMENLRSALDFAAHGLFSKYGASPKPDPGVYFPYALEGQSVGDFRAKQRIDQCIPGLAAARPDIVQKLESNQHFADAKNRWLPRFMELNNANKHQQLTAQTRREWRELHISSGGTGMVLGEGTSISMGPGTSIQMGGLVIPGGQTFDAHRPPRTAGQGKVEVVTWVSFDFSSNGEPVLPFLRTALEGVDRIVTELATL